MKYDAVSFSFAGDKYLGRAYSDMDCQKFVEQCMKDVGLREDLPGSNAWYRHVMRNGWVGTPEECMRTFGQIPKGALLFILENNGKEPAKYLGDGVGNALHIGIVIHRHEGAIHSSQSRGSVCYSKFQDKTIPNGGWNRIGLYNKFTYGKSIDWMLEHGSQGGSEEPPAEDEDEKEVVCLQGKVIAKDGSTVNLRKTKGGDLLERVRVGTPVTVVDYGPEWCKVIVGNKTGWMMTQFVEIQGEVVPGDDDPVEPDPDEDKGTDVEPEPDETVTLKVSAEAAAAAYQFLTLICEQIEKQIGRG